MYTGGNSLTAESTNDSVCHPHIEKGQPLFDITFDNINQRTNARHYKRGKHGQLLNMVQGYATRERIPTGHLSAESPPAHVIRSLPLQNFLPSEADKILLKTELQTVIKHILVNKIPELCDVDACWHIQHLVSAPSRQKSSIVSCFLFQTCLVYVSDIMFHLYGQEY